MILAPELDDLLELRHGAKAIGLASRHKVNSLFSGLYTSIFRGQGMDFEEVREYQQGDEIRNMDWGVTARTGKPHLKVFREERERAVILCVEHSSQMQFGTRGTFKSVQAARAAALIGWSAAGSNERVGAVLFGNSHSGVSFYRPMRGRKALWKMLKKLTSKEEIPLTITSDRILLEVLDKLNHHRETGALIFIVADFNHSLSEDFEQRLGHLKQRHQVVLIPVDDPADKEIPNVGKVVFVAPGGQRMLVNTRDAAGLEKYKQQWQENRQNLINITQRLGLMFIPISTTEDIHHTLTREFSNIKNYRSK